MGKGSTFGGPPAGNASAEEDLNLEELADAMPVHDLPPVVRRRVDALQNLHKQYLDLQKQYHAEVRELERKYQKLYDPVFDKRANIVSGVHEPTDEEAKVEAVEEEEGVKKREAQPGDADIKGVPDFWLSVLRSSGFVANSIFEGDEEALSYLRDIRYSELEGDDEGFTLTFHFAENPYFSNSTLSKTYHMEQDELLGELQYLHATGTKIEWKAGKNLTVKQIKKKTKAKGKKPAKVVTVEEPNESFFNFFSPIQLPTNEEEELAQEDEETMEIDFEIGCVIKDKLIPFSVLYFTGEAADDDEDDDEGEFDFEGDEEDDEGEEDEEEEEAPKKGGRRQGGSGHNFVPPPGAKPGAGAPGQPQQPECKQQ
jgi:nucleosome assembly protein 1-like 1